MIPLSIEPSVHILYNTRSKNPTERKLKLSSVDKVVRSKTFP
jgi:hypothetical protein